MNDLDIAERAKDKDEENKSKLGPSELSMKFEGLNGRYDQLLDLQSKQASVLTDLVKKLGDLKYRLSRLESKIA